jgi:prepilin-type N-terminal cleavage/methylation domain-containing protein
MPQLRKKTVRNITKYSGFTMVEMLIVLAIIAILFATMVTSFRGVRDNLTLNDSAFSLAQDIRYAQRSSLFLKRAANERWIYGIGIDFEKIRTDGTYKVFKWCAPYDDYDVSIEQMTSELPGFVLDPAYAVNSNYFGKINGGIVYNSTAYDTGTYCAKGILAEKLNAVSGYGLTSINSGLKATFVDASGNTIGNTIPLATSDYPRFILFESVTGRAFIYSSYGRIWNYSSVGNVVQIANPVQDLRIKLEPISNPGQSRIITIKAVSGTVRFD